MNTPFAQTGQCYEPLTAAQVAYHAAIADVSPIESERVESIARLGRAGWFAPPEWRPAALKPGGVVAGVSAGMAHTLALQVATATAPTEASVITEDIDLSGCGAPGKRHRYDADRFCKKCKRPDPRRRATNRKITSSAQPAESVAVNALEGALVAATGKRDAAPGGAAAGSGLVAPAEGTPTGTAIAVAGPADDVRPFTPQNFAAGLPTIPSEPIPVLPADPPAVPGGSQTVGTVVEESLPSATVPAALPLPVTTAAWVAPERPESVGAILEEIGSALVRLGRAINQSKAEAA